MSLFRRRLLALANSGGGPTPPQPTPLEDLTARFNFPNGGGYFFLPITLSTGDWFKLKVGNVPANKGVCFVGGRQTTNSNTDATSVETTNDSLFYVKMFGTLYTTTLTYSSAATYIITAKADGVATSPSLGASTNIGTYTFTTPRNIGVGRMRAGSSYVGSNGCGDIYGIEIYGADDTLKHRLIPQPDLTLLDEVTNTSYSKSGGTLTYTAQ